MCLAPCVFLQHPGALRAVRRARKQRCCRRCQSCRRCVPLRGGSAAGANRAGGVCLPLPPLTAASSVEPYFVAGGVDERAAREEAACKVLSNHRKVGVNTAPRALLHCTCCAARLCFLFCWRLTSSFCPSLSFSFANTSTCPLFPFPRCSPSHSAAPGESAASVSRRPSWTPTRNLPMTPLWPLVPTF